MKENSIPQSIALEVLERVNAALGPLPPPDPELEAELRELADYWKAKRIAAAAKETNA